MIARVVQRFDGQGAAAPAALPIGVRPPRRATRGAADDMARPVARAAVPVGSARRPPDSLRLASRTSGLGGRSSPRTSPARPDCGARSRPARRAPALGPAARASDGPARPRRHRRRRASPAPTGGRGRHRHDRPAWRRRRLGHPLRQAASRRPTPTLRARGRPGRAGPPLVLRRLRLAKPRLACYAGPASVRPARRRPVKRERGEGLPRPRGCPRNCER